MFLFQLALLAIIQGLTEFIPVSSSAHLILPAALIEGFEDQGPLIDIAAHVGSLGAVLIYFRHESLRLFRGGLDTARFRSTQDGRLFLLIAAATIPILLVGGLLAVTGIADRLREPVIIAWASIGFGVLLWFSDRQTVSRDHLPKSWHAALVIGAAQALAVIPGTSRSGITITAARYLGFSRPEAARFSMLLAIPTIAAFGLYAGIQIFEDGSAASVEAALLVALFSLLSAWGAIAVFMRLAERTSFTPFVIYRIALGIVLLAIFI